ncbi:MAG: hypothetical protein Q8P41_16800 [Pseudomonadota bacterium]|nr:hypothetical protein [Pseudomonadota bacterium]
MLALALSSLLGCTGSVADDTALDTAPVVATGPGTLALSFRMDDDYLATMAKAGESPVGPFYGSCFKEEDASATGPVDGAVPLFDIEVALDLSADGGPTGVLYTTEPLEPQIVWILGCLDADANGCEEADPITLPNENKFQIAAEAETPIEIYFGMLNPS